MQVSIQIPTLDKEGHSLPFHTVDRISCRVRSVMIDFFTRITSTEGKRFWKDNTGNVIEEKVEIFSAFVDTNYMKFPTASVHGHMTGLASEVKIGLDQEEVFFTVDNAHFNYSG